MAEKKELSKNIKKLKGIDNFNLSLKTVANLFSRQKTMKDIREYIEFNKSNIVFDNYLTLTTGNFYKSNITKVIIPHELLITIANKMSRKDVFYKVILNYVEKEMSPVTTINLTKKYKEIKTTEAYNDYKDEYALVGDTDVRKVSGKYIYNLYSKAKKEKDRYRLRISGQGLTIMTVNKEHNSLSKRYTYLFIEDK